MSQKSEEGKQTISFDLSRRDFHKLTIAAFGGVVGGTLLSGRAMALQEGSGTEESLLLKEPHVCCGLNTCNGHGAGGNNDCSGMGSCATADNHSCKGQGACAGQGGCGSNPGENACTGQGSCAVPLQAEHGAWKRARANFEAAMEKAGKEFSPAPEGCPKS